MSRSIRLISMALVTSCSTSGRVPEVGDRVPARWTDDGSGRPVVIWVMKGEDYLGCATAAGDLRRLQRRYGDRIRMSLLYVGDNPDRVAGFIRRERIDAEIGTFSPREFRRAFGRTRLPAFFVADHSRVLARALSPDGRRPPAHAREVVERAVLMAISRNSANRGAALPEANQQQGRVQ